MKTLRQLQIAINDYIEKHPENLDSDVCVCCVNLLVMENSFGFDVLLDFCEDEE